MRTGCGVVYFFLIGYSSVLRLLFVAAYCSGPLADGNPATISEWSHKNRRKNRPESYLDWDSEARDWEPK
jgi:hypothetical protein